MPLVCRRTDEATMALKAAVEQLQQDVKALQGTLPVQ